MKAVLNVDGKNLKVAFINYVNGRVSSVQVDHGNNVYETYQCKTNFQFDPSDPVADFSKQLEFPELEERIVEGDNKIIEHLEKIIESENKELVSIAIEAMENTDSQPFNTHLTEMQKEYKLAQERLFGFIDAVEEVKAYTEGFYADKNNEPVETENDYAPIE